MVSRRGAHTSPLHWRGVVDQRQGVGGTLQRLQSQGGGSRACPEGEQVGGQASVVEGPLYEISRIKNVFKISRNTYPSLDNLC